VNARRFVLLALAAVVGAIIYATAAPASQQAGPSRAEFNALKARVAKVEKNTNTVVALLAGCLQKGVPVSRYNGYVAVDSTNNQQFQTTALDVEDSGQTPQAYLLDIGQTCASAITHAFGTKLTVVHLHVSARVQR
jgi:type II secretory pathway component PulM